LRWMMLRCPWRLRFALLNPALRMLRGRKSAVKYQLFKLKIKGGLTGVGSSPDSISQCRVDPWIGWLSGRQLPARAIAAKHLSSPFMGDATT
jgi:hypothetical protein